MPPTATPTPRPRRGRHGRAGAGGPLPAAYVEYALTQCERRGIDVFVPRLHQSAIVAHRAEFEAAGTALLAPPPEAVAVFEDKVVAYQAVESIGAPCHRGGGSVTPTNSSPPSRSWSGWGIGPASSPRPARAGSASA